MSVSSERAPDREVAPGDIAWTPLTDISEPGAYICRGSGDLVRVPPTGHAVGAPQLFDRHETHGVYVTRLSPDPFIRISLARIAAADRNLDVRF
ncbi:MAG: hypothetical protein ACE5E6_06525 [Phycisphaerae bacterium]